VGKSTFATNFALSLSRHGRTILVDLDTGTSSIRNAIDVPVTKDLYHFFRKNEPLANCLTTLDRKLDPKGEFRDFAFVAGPLHLIEEITNFGPEYKLRLMHAINALDTDYVILDMKAGLDSNVIDFLPYSNSGILVFTPHLPAATLAASDIVKAILFRRLRLIFNKKSPFFETVEGGLDFWRLSNELINHVEDVYDSSVHTLDEFALDLASNLGETHPITKAVQSTLDYFRVHYVLNLFNGVEDAFDTAVKPFIDNLTRNVSARVGISNLGWVSRSDSIHKANCGRIPALLMEKAKASKTTKAEEDLEELRLTVLGLDPLKKKPLKQEAPSNDPGNHLSRQLDVLKTMYTQKKDDDFYANFDYITQRALYTIQSRRPSEFGDTRIYTPREMLENLFAKSTKQN
jgi:MinD-like ATPase involved in chromosome partitioning or flagellar assembly